MTYLRLLIIFLALAAARGTVAQDLSEKNFDRYTVTDGMSANNVTAVTQDSTGFIWAATPSGLNRFNGSRFVQFHSDNNPASLVAEDLTGMAWLNSRELAVSTAGLHIINTRTGNTRNIYIPYSDKKYQYKFNMMEKVLGDEQGNLFILSRSGFYHYDKTDQLLFRFDYYTGEAVDTSHFYFGRDLFELDKNRLLIISIGGLYVYEKSKKKFSKMDGTEYPQFAEFLDYESYYHTGYQFFQPAPGQFFVLKMPSDTLIYIDYGKKKVKTRQAFPKLRDEFRYRSKLIRANDSLYYITGHQSGFYKITFHAKTGLAYIHPYKYFSNYLCNGMVLDRDQRLWVATSKGLFHQNAERTQVQVAQLPESLMDSFPLTRIDDIFVTRRAVYAGRRGEGGLIVFNKHPLSYQKQVWFNDHGGRGNSIYAIAGIDSSRLMLATDWPILVFDEKTQQSTPITPPGWTNGGWASDLCRDSKGDIWVSAYRIMKYAPTENVYRDYPSYPRLLTVPFLVEEDRDKNIWMAGHGLVRFNTKTNGYDLFIDSFPFIKMIDKQINSMAIDPENNLWFNSNNNGLTYYNITTKTFRHFTREHGLPDDNIGSMIVVGNTLWLACYSGIACIDLKTLRIISFGKEDGFPEMPILKGARFFYDEPEQMLYVGFTSAVARFNPYYILRRKSPSQVFIEHILINGKKEFFLPPREITTGWKENEFLLSIGSVNYSDSYTQRFAYRLLKDENTPWQMLGSQPSFSISNLSPGQHRIQVKIFSINNRWPEQVKEIVINILPPFWQKAWFIILAAVVVVLILYSYVRWRTNLARKKEMEKTHIEKIKAHNYKSQFELEQISNYFSSSLKGKNTVDEVLWDVTSNLISKLDYVDCMIYLWNEDKTRMIQKAAYGPKGKPEMISQNPFEVLPGQGIVGHVMETQQPVLVEDTRTDPRYRVDEAFRLSEICVPIMHNGELIGVIDSEHHEPCHFKERDIKILTTIATLIANKLRQLESEQSLEATNRELSSINEQLAEAQLSALQAQMNPHFVFNALNSIKRMILDGNNEKASRYLSKFALMIRMTLNHSKDIFVTLDQNIEYIKAYLEMEQLRFDDSFIYTITVGNNIDSSETLIPSLMIQPLVENAIWHGLMPLGHKNRKISIAFTQTDNRITCIIEDNGVGIKKSEQMRALHRPLHHSMGLENLQKRIKIMNEKYDMECSLLLQDLSETNTTANGTRVILTLKVITI